MSAATNSTRTAPARDVLARLHAEAKGDRLRFLGFLPKLAAGLAQRKKFWDVMTPAAMKDVYMPVNPDQGQLLYLTARALGAQSVVEFGTSFGISALYLGAAARDNGGQVVTTEIEPNKIETATRNIREAGLDDVVRLLPGDVMKTLADHPGPIDLLFLDGWNALYLPLMNMLGPRLRPGAVLLVDNASFPGVKAFLASVHTSRGFVTTLIESDKGAMELGTFVGPWERFA